MKRLLFFSLVLVFLSSINVFAQEKVTRETKIPDAIEIEFDIGSFQEDSLLSVYDNNGDFIVKYSRFENPNSRYKSIKVYDIEENHRYTIFPDEKSLAVYILDQEGRRAKISGKISHGFLKSTIKSETNFFGQPYVINVFINASLKGVNYTYIISYESKPVLKNKYFYNNISISDKETIANHNYVTDFRVDCGVMALSILLFDEILFDKVVESNKYNSSSDSSSQSFPMNPPPSPSPPSNPLPHWPPHF